MVGGAPKACGGSISRGVRSALTPPACSAAVMLALDSVTMLPSPASSKAAATVRAHVTSLPLAVR